MRRGGAVLEGEAALREARMRVAAHHIPGGATAEEVRAIDTRYHTSGSVPADADSTLLRGVQTIRANFYRHLGTREPTMEQIRGYPPRFHNDLMVAHTIARNSGGNRGLLRPDEQQMLAEVDALRRRIVRD